jgi:hypothetical protein
VLGIELMTSVEEVFGEEIHIHNTRRLALLTLLSGVVFAL